MMQMNSQKYLLNLLVSESKRKDSHNFYGLIGYSVGQEFGFKKKLE